MLAHVIAESAKQRNRSKCARLTFSVERGKAGPRLICVGLIETSYLCIGYLLVSMN